MVRDTNTNRTHVNSALQRDRDNLLLTKYHEGVIAGYSSHIKDFIPIVCENGTGRMMPDELKNLLTPTGNLLIAGPSGCAKTLIAKYLLVQLAKEHRPAIYLEAKYFESLLGPLLDKEIKLLGTPSATQLFNASKRLDLVITLIIDGYNECDHDKQRRLDRCLVAMRNRYAANVVILSQDRSSGPGELSLQIISVAIPDFETKKKIASHFGGEHTLRILEPLLITATSGMEAMLIGTMGSQPIDRKSKFAIFDYYVRKKLGADATVGTRLLIALASHLARSISFIVSIRELERIAEKLNVSPSVIEKMVHEKILSRYFDQFSFGHELYLQAYIAAGIVGSARNDEKNLIRAFHAPINHNSRLFILGAIEDERLFSKVSEQITDSRLIVAMYLGEAGELAHEWTKARFSDLIRKMQEETQQLCFSLVENQWIRVAINEETIYQWSSSEISFIYAIPELLLHGFFVGDILLMARTADVLLENEIKRLWDEAKPKKISLRSELFASIYCPFTQKLCALSCIVKTLHSGMVSLRFGNTKVPIEIKEFDSHAPWTNGSLYIALAFGRFNDGALTLFSAILSCFKDRWKFIPYHLKLDLFDAARNFYNMDAKRIQLIEAINGVLDNSNIFTNSSALEALSALGAFEQEETDEEKSIKAQLQKILNDQENPSNWQIASGLFNAVYDHPYAQGYQNAIGSLNDTEKKEFMIMVVRGTTSGFFTSIAILSLVQLGDPSVAQHLDKWRAEPMPDESSFPQDDLQIYLLVHIVLGQFNFSIDSRCGSFSTVKENAICAVAEINYWLNRPDHNTQAAKDKIEVCWKYLNTTAANIASEVLYQTLSEIRTHDIDLNLKTPVIRIQDKFPDQIASLCRNAINNPHETEVFYKWDKPSQVIHHAIAMLESFGNRLDIPILKPIATDFEYGTTAIRAIQKLQEKIIS